MRIVWFLLATLFFTCSISYAQLLDPLPSWNEGQAKKALIDFVQQTTDKTNPQYVPPQERVAVFDQDGTLWVEQPMYTQIVFSLERVTALASQHPEWKTTEPFKSVLAHDKAAMAAFTTEDLVKIFMATETGMTVEEFKNIASKWLATAKHPRFQRPYTELVYQPMLELLAYLRANGYKTYISTGGGQDFVRVYAERVYGIPPEQVIGSALKTQYIFDNKQEGVLMKTAKPLLNNNFAGKPENIQLFIGKKPRAAFGNSTGDQQMLEYTEQDKGAHLMLLVHHDDGVREYDYGSNSKVGTFTQALMQEAKKSGWVVVSMKKDWKQVFPALPPG